MLQMTGKGIDQDYYFSKDYKKGSLKELLKEQENITNTSKEYASEK